MKLREFILLPLVFTVLTIGIVGYFVINYFKLKRELPTIFPSDDSITRTLPNTNVSNQEIIHSDNIYSPTSSVWRKFTVDGCGNEKVTKITFTLPPGIWNITKDIEDKYLTYFASNVEPTMEFNFGCTTDTTKFNPEIDRCSSQYTKQELVKFYVGGISANSCYEPLSRRLWPFYLPVDNKSQSQITIWSHNIDKDTLAKLFASFQFN